VLEEEGLCRDAELHGNPTKMKKLLLALLLFAMPVLAGPGNAVHVRVGLFTNMPEPDPQTNTFCAANLACTVTGVWTFSTTGPITGSAKWVDVIGGTPDPLANVNTVLNTKLYSVSPLTLPQATYFNQIDISGSHAGAPISFGADFVQFNQARIHDTTGTWPSFWELDAIEAEAEAYGSMAVALPNFRLCALCGQTFVDDKGTDSIVIPFASDIISRGPFRSTVAVSRPGSITVTNGSTTLSGSGTNFTAGDVNKLLWWDGNGTGGSNALVGCTITSVTNATTAACASNWTGITTTTNWWQTTAAGATGPAGSTSSIGSAYSATLTQPVIGTSENLILRLGTVAGHPETPVQAVFDNSAVHQWAFGLQNNANTQANDFILRNFVASATPISLRIRNPGNDGASQKGNVFINASGTGGRVFINGPMPIFAGEGAFSNMGTGGLAVSTGGASGSNAAVAATGVIAIPFGTAIKACNSTCAADISMIDTSGVNDIDVGDATNANHINFNTATGFLFNKLIQPNSAGAADVGGAVLPWGNLWLGTAATNNFQYKPASATGARVLNIPDWGANNAAQGATQNQPYMLILTSQYTNSTTTFSNVAGGATFQFPVNANQNYTATCHLYYQSAATGGLNIEFTGPASPTVVAYGLDDPSSATTFNSAVATAFGTSLGQVVGTAATNFDATVSFSLVNGANAGTVNMLAKSTAAAQLQIQAGSFCQIQ